MRCKHFWLGSSGHCSRLVLSESNVLRQPPPLCQLVFHVPLSLALTDGSSVWLSSIMTRTMPIFFYPLRTAHAPSACISVKSTSDAHSRTKSSANMVEVNIWISFTRPTTHPHHQCENSWACKPLDSYMIAAKVTGQMTNSA